MIWQRRPKCKIKSCLGHSVLHVTLFLSAKVIWCPNIFSFSVCFTKTYSRRSLCSCAVPVCPLALMTSCQVLLKSDNLSGRYEADYSGLVATPLPPLVPLHCDSGVMPRQTCLPPSSIQMYLSTRSTESL